LVVEVVVVVHVVMSCATSSGAQASENNRADAAARNIEVRFTADLSCGALSSAAYFTGDELSAPVAGSS